LIARSAIFLSAFPYNVPRTENLTGQILAGLDPLEAVKYQILLMFLYVLYGGVASHRRSPASSFGQAKVA